jgi:hypothetical protein
LLPVPACGVSTGDFQQALAALLGREPPNLSPSVIARLKSDWQGEYERWQQRDPVRLVSQPDPTGTIDDRRKAARSPTCYGALVSGFATAQLHHARGRDRVRNASSVSGASLPAR